VEQVRLAGLRVIGMYLARLNVRTRQKLINDIGLTWIATVLAPRGFGERSYTAMLQLCVGATDVPVLRPRLDASTTFDVAGAVLPPLLQLLGTTVSLSVVHVALQVNQTKLKLSLISNPSIRKDLVFLVTRESNADDVLALPCWPLFLLELPMRVQALCTSDDDFMVSIYELFFSSCFSIFVSPSYYLNWLQL